MATLFQSAYLDWHEHWSEVPPLPSTPLVRLKFRKAPLTVRIAHIGTTNFRASAARCGTPVEPDEGDEHDAELTLWREIRLALGPTRDSNEIGPMFESRAFVTVELSSRDDCLSQQLSLARGYTLEGLSPMTSDEVLIDGLWHRITPLVDVDALFDDWSDFDSQAAILASSLDGKAVDHPYLWEQTPLSDKKNCFEHYYVSWTPLAPAYVRHWLDRPTHDCELPLDAISSAASATKSQPWFPSHSAAHSIELAVEAGVLKAELGRAVESMRSAFDDYQRMWLERMNTQTEATVEWLRASAAAAGPSEPDETGDISR